MQAQVEITTTSANAKHWPTHAKNEAKARLTCFSTPSARSTVQNAARDVANQRNCSGSKLTMNGKEGLAKECKTCELALPPNSM